MPHFLSGDYLLFVKRVDNEDGSSIQEGCRAVVLVPHAFGAFVALESPLLHRGAITLEVYIDDLLLELNYVVKIEPGRGSHTAAAAAVY